MIQCPRCMDTRFFNGLPCPICVIPDDAKIEKAPEQAEPEEHKAKRLAALRDAFKTLQDQVARAGGNAKKGDSP